MLYGDCQCHHHHHHYQFSMLWAQSPVTASCEYFRVSQKIFFHLIGNEEFGIGFFSGAFEEHGFSNQLGDFL